MGWLDSPPCRGAPEEQDACGESVTFSDIALCTGDVDCDAPPHPPHRPPPPPPPPSTPPLPRPPHLPGCEADVLAALQGRQALSPGKSCFRLKSDALACESSYFVWPDNRGVSLCFVDEGGRCRRRGEDILRCSV